MTVNGKIYLKDNSGNINEFNVPGNDANAVHKSGNETIADTKTFTGTIITANNSSLRRNDFAGFLQLGFTTVLNGGRLNLFGKDYTSDPGSFALMTGDGTNAKTLKGTTAGVLSWDGSITATGFTGPLTGNATSATKATQDSDGNAINTTYLKLSGGTMTGNVAWNKTATIGGESKAHNAGLSLNANSLDFGVYDWTNSKWAWKITQAGVASFYGNADTATKATQDGNGAVIANTYLKLTGGTLTGVLNIFTDQAYAVGTANALLGVRYKNAAGDVNYASNVLDVIGTDGTDGYNVPISFGSANGTTHIGAGESRRGFLGARTLYNNENLYLTADGSVNIFTNCSNDNATYCGPLTFNGTASATGGRVSISNADKINANNIELNGDSNNGGYIDFHFNNSTADYTTRLIESASGTLQLTGILKIVSNAMGNSSTPGLLLTGTSTNFFINAVNTNITKGSTPSANTYWGLNCYGKDYDNYNKRIAMFEGGLTTGNVSLAAIRAYNCTTNTNTGNCSIEAHVDASGNAYTYAPTPATADNSTKIATTAFVKAQGYLTTHQSLSNYVTLNTAQTITAKKTFGTIVVSEIRPTSNSDEVAIYGNTSSVYGSSIKIHGTGASYVDDNGTTMYGCLEIMAGNTSTNSTSWLTKGGFWLTAGIVPTGNCRPANDGSQNLGTSSAHWKQLFASTTTISTSDERKKNIITKISNDILDVWEEVDWYQFKFNDAVEEKGDNARLHTGLVAQRVDEVFKSHNLDISKYGLFCYDKWNKSTGVKFVDKDGNEKIIEEEKEAGDLYSIRYEEALCMEAAYQRRRAERAEARISELETEVNLLKEQMRSILEKLS